MGLMELRDHLIGPCARRIAEEEVGVDVGALVRRLMFLERYTLRSISLLEVRALVRAFGEGACAVCRDKSRRPPEGRARAARLA